MSVDTFDVLDAASARSTLVSWLDDEWNPPRSAWTPIDGDLRKIVDQLVNGPVIYQLRYLDEDAHHAAGFVVDGPYFELVVMDLRVGRLALIAGGCD